MNWTIGRPAGWLVISLSVLLSSAAVILDSIGLVASGGVMRWASFGGFVAPPVVFSVMSIACAILFAIGMRSAHRKFRAPALACSGILALVSTVYVLSSVSCVF